MALIRNPLLLALDVDSKSEAYDILDKVGDLLGGIKIGPRLSYRYGASLISEIAKIAPVFVDNKYFDIQSTMVAAVKTSFEAGATLVTVHALAGSEALAELSKLEKELNLIRPFKILAVTVLTSWNQFSLSASLQNWPIEKHVQNLTQEVYDAGLRGLVCSGHELKQINFPDIYKVIPGIRLANSDSLLGEEDQKRTMTPKEAMEAGASALVVGRPILKSQNPRQTIVEILESSSL